MSSQFSFSEPVLTAEHNHQHIFTSQCLKRKLETSGRNGFTAVEENVMCAGEQDCNLISEVGRCSTLLDYGRVQVA